MSQKKYTKFYQSWLYMSLNTKMIIKPKKLVVQVVSSLEFSVSPKIGNTSKFFKKLAFIGLALNNVMFNKGRLATIRSVIASLWDMIATNVLIF